MGRILHNDDAPFGALPYKFPVVAAKAVIAAEIDNADAVSYTHLDVYKRQTYDCLVDLEPSFNEGGKQQVYIGSVGKTMPAVLVQGAKAHVVECFHGLNAIGVLAEMFMATELAPEFSDVYKRQV